MSFEAWMLEVDRITESISGLSSSDLADVPFRLWYDDDMTPHSAAIELLRENDFSFDEEEEEEE